MRYFPQDVLMCTSTVQDQSANICILCFVSKRSKDPLDTKHKIFKKKNEFINVMFHVYNWSISLKVLKLNPRMVLHATSGREMALYKPIVKT